MGRINPGTLLQDLLRTILMITLEWETDNWQSGKDKDIITSLHAMLKMVKSMQFKMLTTEILKVSGLTFTIPIA